MQTRRTIITSLAGSLSLIGSGAAVRAEVTEGSDIPTAKVIPGEPPILDYGGGVKVPSSREAFFTLWEGSTFWLTFGFGISQAVETAQSQATKQAFGVMKFMLLTLAFAPERLVKDSGNGWHKKDPKAHDFVLGELELPKNPNKAVNDLFLGGGNIEISPFWNWSNYDRAKVSGSMQNAVPAISGTPGNMRQADRHAFISYIVLKKDLSLADVRSRAVILQK